MLARLVDTCWRWFKLGAAMACVAAAAIGVYLYVNLNDELRVAVEAKLAERFPHCEIRVGGVRLVEGRGIVLEDVECDLPSAAGARQPLLEVDELTLQCDVGLPGLVQAGPQIEAIHLVRPRLWLVRSREGTWNLAALCQQSCPEVRLSSVMIRQGWASLVDEATPQAPPVVVDVVDVDVTPAESSDGRSMVAAIRGVASGPELKKVEFMAEADLAAGVVTGAATVQHLQLGDTTHAWLASRLPALAPLPRLSGEVGGKLTWKHDWLSGARPTWTADLELRGGRLEDARWVRPAVDLTGRATASHAQLRIESLYGKWGDAEAVASLVREGWDAEAPLALSARIANLTLDRQLYQTLPQALQREWDKYQPAGEVDVTAQATYDGRTWRPTATATGRRLSFESDRFRYRLTQGSGTVRYTGTSPERAGVLDLDLTGRGGGQPVRIVGQIFDPRPGAAGWVEITGENLEIESRLIDALEPRPRAVIASLRPAGRFDVRWRLERPVASAPAARTSLQLELHDVAVNYEKFPYPLRGIHGAITAEDNHWSFADLASGGNRPVRCRGRLDPVDGGMEVALHFEGQQTPLDDDLFEALPPTVQRAWAEIRPRGHVDFVADVYHRTGLSKPNIRVVISPRPETALVKPTFFDYLMDNVEGEITYHDGEVRLDDVRSTHDRTAIRTNGQGFFGADGGWRMRLTDLTIDRVTPRRDLLVALPRPLSKLVDQLRPTGSFRIHDGVLEFRKAASPIAPLEASWDVQLDCHQTDLQAGVEVANLHGTIQLKGAYDGTRSATAGELKLDSVTFRNLHLTNVSGPLWVDDNQCRLGRWATEQQGVAPRRLTAVAYDGQIASDVWVAFRGLPEYGVELNVVGADLNRLVVEGLRQEPQFQGKVDADVALRGSGRQLENLGGSGNVRVREANFYQLPLLMGMLKMLRTGSGDTTAFNESDVKFRLQGRHIYLDQLNFLGDVVNLYGRGYTNFDQELKLVFHGEVGRTPSRLPLIKSFVSKVNQQVLQMYVDGTLAQPNVTTEALPGVNRLIEQLQADLASPPSRNVQR